MDQSILIQYSDMVEEIKDLRRRISDDQKKIEQLKRTIVTDSVTCGKKGRKPIKTVKVQGYPARERQRRIDLMEQRQAKLQKMEVDLLEMQIKAEQYIESIEKSELRIMFRLYFLDDLTYCQVANRMNHMFPRRSIEYTDENVRKRIQRFFENVPQCPV